MTYIWGSGIRVSGVYTFRIFENEGLFFAAPIVMTIFYVRGHPVS